MRTVVELIAGTRTDTGLTVQAAHDIGGSCGRQQAADEAAIVERQDLG